MYFDWIKYNVLTHVNSLDKIQAYTSVGYYNTMDDIWK